MNLSPLSPPCLIVHCDWGTDESKRWMACARLGTDGRYTAAAPEPVGKLDSLLARLRQRVSDPGLMLHPSSILLGFDFPIGIPATYARKTGAHSFLQMLPLLGRGRWSQFYEVANEIEEVSAHRPFYPDKPGKRGEKPQLPFLKALDVSTANDLRRACERKLPGRAAASPLFWTVGGNQVGKSAIRGWREVLTPALADANVKIWPFHGGLREILRPGAIVIAETYPTQYHELLFGHPLRGKRLLSRRKSVGKTWIARADQWNICLDAELRHHIEYGFPSAATRRSASIDDQETSDNEDDRFDAAIGLFGMIDTILKPIDEPNDEIVQGIEGWILGQPYGL